MGDDDFESNLQAALVTRPVIEQAKGILAMARRATPEQAYEELRFVSQHHNVKLNRLATALVDAAARRRTDDPLLRRVLWREWGDVFPDQNYDPV